MQETTIRGRREKLRAITDGPDLEDTYGATLDRIKAQGGYKSRLGTTALMWICHSKQELGTEELCQALAVEIESTDCSADDAPLIQTVLSCCQGFVVVDEEGSTVRLVHHTLREYLVNHRSLFQSPHSKIAETCLTYLNSHQVMALSDSRVQSTQHLPFLEYSALYWGDHIKKQLTDVGKELALKLFSHYECHVSIRPLLESMLDRDFVSTIVEFRKFTGLHFASIFGLVEIARALTMMDGVDINGVDETSGTPLIWAAMNGHEAVVKLLLEQKDVDPNRVDVWDQTPISWASVNGHEAVVELLLGREDINLNKPDSYGRAPVSRAAENGHEAVVKLLLAREGINPDMLNNWDQTPIFLAAENGHEAVVELLLGREDVNPDRPDNGGDTPISIAAESGHDSVVKLLLGREDVNPDRLLCGGLTPILSAARNGHEAVVKLLLRLEDVNPDRPDKRGRTPISLAAGNGHEGVVKLLLGRRGVNPSRPDSKGRTPIWWAVENGHEAVVLLFHWQEDGPHWPDV